jgi:hypothetical protein
VPGGSAVALGVDSGLGSGGVAVGLARLDWGSGTAVGTAVSVAAAVGTVGVAVGLAVGFFVGVAVGATDFEAVGRGLLGGDAVGEATTVPGSRSASTGVSGTDGSFNGGISVGTFGIGFGVAREAVGVGVA